MPESLRDRRAISNACNTPSKLTPNNLPYERRDNGKAEWKWSESSQHSATERRLRRLRGNARSRRRRETERLYSFAISEIGSRPDRSRRRVSALSCDDRGSGGSLFAKLAALSASLINYATAVGSASRRSGHTSHQSPKLACNRGSKVKAA